MGFGNAAGRRAVSKLRVGNAGPKYCVISESARPPQQSSCFHNTTSRSIQEQFERAGAHLQQLQQDPWRRASWSLR